MAELIAAPAEIFRSIPDTVSDAAESVLQPLADVKLSVHDVGVTSGDTVAVVGSGVKGFYWGQVMIAGMHHTC
jgi:threonine dehydrogenase-like Zn-dependent dehydrogenase